MECCGVAREATDWKKQSDESFCSEIRKPNRNTDSNVNAQEFLVGN